MFKQQSIEAPSVIHNPPTLTVEELEKMSDDVSEKLDAIRKIIKTITGKMTLQQDVEMRALLEELDNLYEQAERIASKPVNDATNK